jgi:CubicO group peptidase (beta-lactamase class C family)
MESAQMRMYSVMFIATCSVVCSAANPQLVSAGTSQSAQAAAPERVASETQRFTPGGAQFTVPAGWSIATQKNLVVLTPPEADTHLAIVDTQAPDARAAVATAWAAYKPDSKRPIKLVTPRPAREGWDERQVFEYETSPNERVEVVAIAERAGTSWTVMILDGSEPTVEKRGAPIGLIFESLRPKGYARESFAGRKANPLDAARIEQMKSFVQSAMQQLGVPGAAIALIDGGKVVYEGGLGVRELGKPDPVDENTLFMAASNTKGMTTLLLAILADEKKLAWDQPVIELYPAFRLGNPETTKQVLVKHLICACTGMPRQDMEWLFEFKNSTPKTVFNLLATTQPTSKFGEVFQYSNLMAAAAGYVGGHLASPDMELGAGYNKAMQTKIFDPLGMRATTFDYARALAGNHASPHGDDVDGNARVAKLAFDYSAIPIRPAGGEWTSAHDLARYVMDEINLGKLPDGRQLVSQENLLMRRKPQITLGQDSWYGMGLIVDKKYGVPVVSHGGSMAGYKSDFWFLPDYGVGAVLLTNADTGGFIDGTFGRRLLEVLFDGKPEAAGDLASAANAYKANRAKERERLVVPADPAVVDRVAPHYTSTELGQLDVVRTNGGATFDFGEWSSAVASRKNDDGTISMITIDPTNSGFEFVVGEKAGKRTLTLRDAQHEYVFNEVD